MKKKCWILIGKWHCEQGSIFITRVYINAEDAIRDRDKYNNECENGRKYFYLESSFLYDNEIE